MADSDRSVNSNASLSVLLANNPSLAEYWPGAKLRQVAKVTPEPAVEILPPVKQEGAGSSIKAGCIPCSLGHFGVCSSLLQEGVRFAQSDGIDSDVPIDRINTCLDELNGLERKDLTPELIDTLPEWEKDLALRTLASSRAMRHELESIETLDNLIHTSAQTTIIRKALGREWFKKKLAIMSPKEQKQLAEEATKIINKEV